MVTAQMCVCVCVCVGGVTSVSSENTTTFFSIIMELRFIHIL